MRQHHLTLDLNSPIGCGRRLEEQLLSKVIGQDAAVHAVVQAYERHLAGLGQPGLPVGNLLFLGPSGAGKTYLVEQLAETLAGSPDSMIAIDCAEFQHDSDTSKLLGAGPGWIGHKETKPIFTQKGLDAHISKRCPISIVLFDEIEKANPKLWDLLLGITGQGRVRNGSNELIKFDRSLIVMTSNLGAKEMNALLMPRMGFGQTVANPALVQEKLSKVGTAAVRKRFRRELFNRLDEIVVFNALGPESLEKILTLELERIQDVILKRRGTRNYILTLSDAARKQLLKTGIDPELGARPLRRTIKGEITDRISTLVLSNQIKGGDLILVDYNERFEFIKKYGMMTLEQMQMARNIIYVEGQTLPLPEDLSIS